MLFKKDPAKAIRKLMIDRDMNVNELADVTGLSQKQVSAIINGKVARPHRSSMESIADALNVRLNKIWPEV